MSDEHLWSDIPQSARGAIGSLLGTVAYLATHPTPLEPREMARFMMEDLDLDERALLYSSLNSVIGSEDNWEQACEQSMTWAAETLMDLRAMMQGDPR
ncbi:MAG: hypothetical protein GY745_18450 [Actinomycetia bacterium]|nr:hypothetical protein [Actinomycetes bacterium]MCP3911535.1 hypothetical protein [Actinomycetes bacterium]MCP4087009.1 hypothetical protein [Actinomycetes bacterium]